jgi:hypothetical protein
MGLGVLKTHDIIWMNMQATRRNNISTYHVEKLSKKLLKQFIVLIKFKAITHYLSYKTNSNDNGGCRIIGINFKISIIFSS